MTMMNDHHHDAKDNAKKEVTRMRPGKQNSFNLLSFLSGLFGKRRRKPDNEVRFKTISAKALIASEERYCLIDLRSIDDFFKDHIVIDRKGISFNLPYESFHERRKELQRFMTKKLLLYSDDDSKATSAARELSASGFDVTVLIGGYDSYKHEMYQ